MKDHIIITDFSIPCRIGTTAQEKSKPQKISLDLKLFIPMRRASHRDKLELSADYAMVLSFLKGFIGQTKFNLVETMAEKCAQFLLAKFPLKAVEIAVWKAPFANPKSVGVKIFRTRLKKRT